MQTLTLTLVENSGTVTGAGSLVASNGSNSLTLPLAVSGAYSAPTLALTMTSTGYQPIALSVTVSRDAMSGTMNGSGYTNEAVTLSRH